MRTAGPTDWPGLHPPTLQALPKYLQNTLIGLGIFYGNTSCAVAKLCSHSARITEEDAPFATSSYRSCIGLGVALSEYASLAMAMAIKRYTAQLPETALEQARPKRAAKLLKFKM